MARLAGKVALISGGARGQGAAEARLFVREGAAVVFGDVLDDDGKKVEAEIRAAGGQATYVHLNVTREADWRAAVATAVQTYGRLSVLVNNAGILFRAKIEDTSEEDWDRIMAVNVKGVFLGTKCAIPAMRQAGGGSIINISSIAGVYGSTMMSHYGASKAAVINFTRALGMAWGRKGVRVNCIAPGPVETEGYLGVLTKQDPAAAKKAYDTVASRVGMGRWGKVEEIAYPCIFLASAASSFMTGETIVIDGGPAPQLGDG